MKRTVYNNVLVKQTIAPAAQTITTPLNGTGVDRDVSFTTGGSVHYKSMSVVIETGVVNDGTHAVIIEESDDNSAFTTVAAADLQGGSPAVTTADDNKVFEHGYLGNKRYLRVSWTQTGGTTLTTFRSANILLGDPAKLPVARA